MNPSWVRVRKGLEAFAASRVESGFSFIDWLQSHVTWVVSFQLRKLQNHGKQKDVWAQIFHPSNQSLPNNSTPSKTCFFCFKKYASFQEIWSNFFRKVPSDPCFFLQRIFHPSKKWTTKNLPSKVHLKDGIPNPLSRIHGTIVWYGIFTVQVPTFGQFVWVFIIGKNTIVPWESVLGFGGRAEASQVTYPGSTPATVSFVPRILPTVGGVGVAVWLVKLQIFFIFTPKIGEDFQFDEYFSNGWFNHQPVVFVVFLVGKNVQKNIPSLLKLAASLAPENGWLEYDSFPFGAFQPIFRGEPLC